MNALVACKESQEVCKAFRDAFKRAKRKGGEGQTWIDGV